MSKKDLKIFAGLNNIEVDAKESIFKLITFIDLCAKFKITMSNKNSVHIANQQLNDVSRSLRQHLWDDLEDHYPIKTHCINYCLGNDDMISCKNDIEDAWHAIIHIKV